MVDVASCETIVGLEIHVQLRTASKLFCGCAVRADAKPNALVCPVCLGHPGALPVLNREAVRLALRAGLAMNCTIPSCTNWDRKSYYYPDLPKNYQISQYDRPLATGGHIEIDVGSSRRRIRLVRAHLEEDAGKSVHDRRGATLVDLNRAGIPLLEIVTEPDLTSAEEAHACCTQLHQLLVYLEVSDGVMQQGHMRFEPNVNVRIVDTEGRTHRTPIVEIKNLNSFRAVRDAIRYESGRQLKVWRADPGYVRGTAPNENRGWNADRGVTEHQRRKEAADDYRYFPEPDLLELSLDSSWVDRLRASIPELPVARQRRWCRGLGVSPGDARVLAGHRALADLFDAVVEAGAPSAVACKQMINLWLHLATEKGVCATQLGVTAERMAALARMTADGTVNSTSAFRLGEAMLTRPEPPEVLAGELGYLQVRDRAMVGRWVQQAFLCHPEAVQTAVGGGKKSQAAVGFLHGQVMQQSRGRADPRLVAELVAEALTQAGPRD